MLGGQRKKPTFFQHLPADCQDRERQLWGGGRQNGVGAGGMLMEEEGTRPTTEEGKG